MKPKQKRYRIPLFGGTLVVCPTLDDHTREFNRLSRYEGYTLGGPGATRDAPGSSCTSAFVIANELRVLVHVAHRGAACHEAVHCAQAVAEQAGMDPLREQEAFAYLTQWAFGRITGDTPA